MKIDSIIRKTSGARYKGVVLFDRWAIYLSESKMKPISPSRTWMQKKEYKQFRKKVFSSRPHICERCGVTDQRLELHHIVRIADNPDLALVDSNAQLLCHECHMEIHGKRGAAREKYRQDIPREIDYELALAFAGAF